MGSAPNDRAYCQRALPAKFLFVVGSLVGALRWGAMLFCPMRIKKLRCKIASEHFHGDPYGNRTHVTAVKGRCLNRLTNGPGSGDLIRTGDIPGMNRLLYQLSYAAMCGQMISAPPKSASLLYPSDCCLSRKIFKIFMKSLGILSMR